MLNLELARIVVAERIQHRPAIRVRLLRSHASHPILLAPQGPGARSHMLTIATATQSSKPVAE